MHNLEKTVSATCARVNHMYSVYHKYPRFFESALLAPKLNSDITKKTEIVTENASQAEIGWPRKCFVGAFLLSIKKTRHLRR